MSKLKEFAKDAIGIPFVDNGREAETGWDCWGLCVSAFKSIGIDLSGYEHIDTWDVEEAGKKIAEQTSQRWKEVKIGDEREWDVIYLRPAHLGIVIERGKMLHVMAGTETCICSYHSPLWKSKIVGIFRHGELS